MATAKVTLSADVAGLKQKVEEAKKLLTDLGSVKINDQFTKSIKEGLEKDLAAGAKKVESEIGKVKDALKSLGDASKNAFDDEKIKQNIRSLAELERRLKSIQSVQGQLSKVGNSPGVTPSAGGGGGLEGLTNLMPGGAIGKKILSLIGVGAVMATVQKRMNVAQERLGVKALTGGALAARGSDFGFTEPERRQRSMDIARAVGKDMSGKEISAMVNQGELFERTHGVSSGTQASLTGAVRKSGGDSIRAMSTAMKAAGGAGFTGSKVTEFLQSMAEGITSMSEGVNIDTDSLMGFAGALSTMPFFKDDPARAAKTAQSLNEAFKSGDRFQQALVARTMQGTGGGGFSPAEMEVRKGFGLFGKPSEEFLKLPGMGGVNRAFKGKPGDLIGKLFQQIMKDTEGLPEPVRFEQFRSAMNLTSGAADPLYTKLASGKSLTDKDLSEAKKGSMDPRERLNATFSGLDKSMMNLRSGISRLTEALSDEVAAPVGELTDAIYKALLPGDAQTTFLKEREELDKSRMSAAALKVTGGRFLEGLAGPKTKSYEKKMRAIRAKRSIGRASEVASGPGPSSYDIENFNEPIVTPPGQIMSEPVSDNNPLPFLEKIAIATERMSRPGKKTPEGSRIVSEVAFGT